MKDILNFQVPQTLKSFRSFLGLAGHYRCFIRHYAQITKPHSQYIRGEKGKISSSQSKKSVVNLSDEAQRAFCKIKTILGSEDVLLLHPDYTTQFQLTTHASLSAIRAVLSQNGKPISMISRTLSRAEENYVSNEREILAIVRALQKLRNYLCGVKKINIYTDHQPLSYLKKIQIRKLEDGARKSQ